MTTDHKPPRAALADIAEAISRAREALHTAKILSAIHCRGTLLVDYVANADSTLRDAAELLENERQ